MLGDILSRLEEKNADAGSRTMNREYQISIGYEQAAIAVGNPQREDQGRAQESVMIIRVLLRRMAGRNIIILIWMRRRRKIRRPQHRIHNPLPGHLLRHRRRRCGQLR